jgi:hypothetical protein
MAKKIPTRFDGKTRRLSHDEHPTGRGGFIDQNPDLDDGKRALRLSGSGVLRRREPTNPAIASKHPNMVFDHSNQLPVWPNGDEKVLIEASQKTGTKYSTMNRNGHPMAICGDFVGGSPDDAGNPFGKPSALRGSK